MTIYFTDQSTGSPTGWEWDFGDGSGKAYNQNPSHTYAANTTGKTYTVNLKVTKGAASDVETKTAYITIHETPVVNFSATPLTGCAPLKVQFTNSSTAGGNGSNTYYWYFGASGNASTASPEYTFNNSGNYNITFNVTNSWGCQGTATKNGYIKVVPRPVASFSSPNTTNCSSPALVSFSAASSTTAAPPLSYAWAFDVGNPVVPGSVSISNTYTGTPRCWSPKLVVTDGNGCVDSIEKKDYICTINPQITSSMPGGFCVGTTGNFSAVGTPAGGNYTWEWGDGSPDGNSDIAGHKYGTPGSKTVKVTYSYKGCNAVSTKTVVIYPKPVSDFTISPDTLCPASVTTQFIPSGNAVSYLWDFGDRTLPSNANSPTHTYNNDGFFTPYMVATSDFGCTDTVRKIDYVKIYDLGTDAWGTDTAGCKPRTVKFFDSAFTTITDGFRKKYPYPIASYQWNFGDGIGTSNLKSPQYTYTVSGVYKAYVTMTTTKGCKVVDTVTVLVGTKPIPDFTATPRHVCNRDEIIFTDLSRDTVDTWEWSMGDKTIYRVKEPHHKYTSPGVYDVRLKVSYNFCDTTILKTQYIIVDSPGAAFIPKYSCDTLKKVKFNNQTMGGTSYLWNFGDSQTDTAKDPTHIYANYGTYTVVLKAFNSRSGCTDQIDAQVTVLPKSTTLSASDTTVCPGDTVTFRTVHTGLGLNDYRWYVDDVFDSDSTARTSTPFSTIGFHKVTLKMMDEHGCWDSIVKNPYIFVSKPFVFDTATPVTGCAPLTVNFTDNSYVTQGATIASRTWDFGNGVVTTTSKTISRTYTRGVYNVRLVVTDNIGCKDSLLKTAYITAVKPQASFTVKDTACLGELLTFSNISSSQPPTTYWWDLGDGTTSTSATPQHAYNTFGSFDVTMVVTDGIGCKDTVSRKAAITTVKPNVSFDITSDSVAVCPPLLVNFKNTSTQTVTPYAWTLGDGNTSSAVNPTNLYTAPGYYTVMLIGKHRLGCADTAYRHVNILGYDGSFDYGPLEGCAPLTVTFTAVNTNVASMVWDFSDGYTSSMVGTSVTHTYTHPGSYIPKLLYGDNKGCKALSGGVKEIQVDAVETDFFGDAPCQFSTVTLIDTTKTYFYPKVKWRWTFDDGTVSDKQAPKHYYGAPGKYPVKLYVENGQGCKDSITKDLEIFGLPEISAGADTLVCLADSVMLTAKGGVSYLWNFAPSLSCTACPNPYAFPKTDAFYIVVGTDEHNCKNSDTVNVKVKYKVAALVTADQEICDKEKVQLDAKGGKTYLWLPPDGLNDNRSSSPVATPGTSTRYMVVSYEGRCIPDTDMVNITVYPLPTVKATGEATIVAGNSTVIQATGNRITKFLWEPAESLSCTDCPDPTASPLKTTDYKITVFTDHNCQDSDRVKIIVLCDESQLFIPNTFTPNGDGMNDIFYPRGTGLSNVKSFRIYTRWGELVHERLNLSINDKAAGWDGKFNGNELPPDVFVYMIETICDDGKLLLFKGDITLVR